MCQRLLKSETSTTKPSRPIEAARLTRLRILCSRILVVLLTIYGLDGLSATISRVQGNKMVLEPGPNETFAKGDEHNLIDPRTGASVGLVVVRTVKGNRAVAELVKGQADVGYTTQLRTKIAVADDYGQMFQKEPRPSYRRGFSAGVLFGFASQSLTVANSKQSGDIALTGTNLMNVLGEYSLHFSKALTFRGTAGIETFSGTSSVSGAGCSNEGSCIAKAQYLSVGGVAQYNIVNRKIRFWVGAGYSYWATLNKSTNIDSLELGSGNHVVNMGLGCDYRLSQKSYIPLELYYDLFPMVSSVKAQEWTLRMGYGIRL